MRTILQTLVLANFLIGSLATVAATGKPDLVYSKAEVLYQNTFDNPSNWVVEQMPGGTFHLENGALHIDDAKGCTVWFKEKLAGPVMIEYDVTLVKKAGANDNVRDLNCFWMAIDPKYPTDIFEIKREEANLLITIPSVFTMLATEDIRTRKPDFAGTMAWERDPFYPNTI